MKIALYGGSFNPPHLGHIEAAKTVAAELRPDLFLVIPDNIPPHKDMDEGSPTAQQRLELCRIAFREVPGAEVSDLELKREGRSYTADTVEALRARYPEDELILVMGTDMLLSFEEWYRFEYLLRSCSLAVLAREDDEREKLEAHAAYLRQQYNARILLLPHEPLPMSSREIREALRLRLGREQLDDQVYHCIIRHNWYDALPELSWLREKAYAYLKPSRVGHVAGCESEAVILAKHWGEDPEQAATAGILHDITKKLNLDEQLKLCEKYGIINDNAELRNVQLLHAKTGAALAKDLFGVSEAVAQAIRWHTTGKPDMTTLEKILYLADVIEPTRDFPGVDRLRALCYEDLNLAMRETLRSSLEDLRSRGIEAYAMTLDAYEWYAREE